MLGAISQVLEVLAGVEGQEWEEDIEEVEVVEIKEVGGVAELEKVEEDVEGSLLVPFGIWELIRDLWDRIGMGEAWVHRIRGGLLNHIIHSVLVFIEHF